MPQMETATRIAIAVMDMIMVRVIQQGLASVITMVARR